MNISALLLHRSLGVEVYPTKPPREELESAVTASLYGAVECDPTGRFTAGRGHRGGVACIGCDEGDGRWMVTGGADGSTLLWDLESEDKDGGFKSVAAVPKTDRPTHGISSVRFNPHNPSLFSQTSHSATLSLHSLSPTTITTIQTFNLDSNLYTHSISPASASAILVAAGSSPHIRLLDPRTSQASQSLFGHVSAVLSVSWSPIHSFILASGGKDGSLRIWDIRFGSSCLGTLDMETFPKMANRAAGRAHEGGVNSLLWTKDGTKIVSCGMDNRIRVWDMHEGVNARVVFPPVVRNKFQAEYPMTLVEEGEKEVLLIGNEGQLIGFDIENGKMVKRVGVPKSDIRDGMGRIMGLAKGRSRMGEVYTAHTVDNKNNLGKEGIARWRPRWMWEEEEIIKEKTEGEKLLEDIFERVVKGRVTFT